MIDAITYEEMLDKLRTRSGREGIVGILFTRPELETGKSIMASLEYYHDATNNKINFYLPGYGAYWPLDLYEDKRKATTLGNKNWFYSPSAFNSFVVELEDKTNWEYSGDSDLVLMPYKNGQLELEQMKSFCIEQMIKDNVVLSVNEFFTDIARKARRYGFSNSIELMTFAEKYLR